MNDNQVANNARDAVRCTVSVTGEHRVDHPYCKDCGLVVPATAADTEYAAGVRDAARVANLWAMSHSCDSHDYDPCCHVRTGAAIEERIRALAPAGDAPPVEALAELEERINTNVAPYDRDERQRCARIGAGLLLLSKQVDNISKPISYADRVTFDFDGVAYKVRRAEQITDSIVLVDREYAAKVVDGWTSRLHENQ
jgi:hypothetical protein